VRTVLIPGTETRTSALGFGTSALVGGRTTREALRLLDTAFDAGVRHFDVARAYGTGDAESLVGRFAAGRRDQLTIASKFGIDPVTGTPMANLAKRMVRMGTRRSPILLRFLRRHSGKTVQRGAFTPEKARGSLETSLRELGTTYLDIYLLHECTAQDWQQPHLLRTLAELASEGRIRSYGTAAGYSETAAIFEGPDPHPPVAQFESDLLSPNEAGVQGKALAITHGCFRRTLSTVRQFLAGDRLAAEEWSKALDVDVTSGEEISGLLLCEALRSNPDGIVLFSSGEPRNIERNARLASESPYESAQLADFAGRVREALRR
jgi:aryl-alcohol dehydrogenase-like predicted oxidoreductase